jgi:hypothetical protein
MGYFNDVRAQLREFDQLSAWGLDEDLHDAEPTTASARATDAALLKLNLATSTACRE